MGSLAWRARAGVLLLAGAVVVHQLVYGLSGVRPDEHAHAYLGWLRPVLAGLVLLAVAELAVRALGVHRRSRRPPPRGHVLAPVLTLLLLAIFAGQEAAETWLTPSEHHHALRELIIGHGLWFAAPVSAFVAFILALVLRGAAAVEAWTLAVEAARAPAPVLLAVQPPARPRRALPDVLAVHLAGRGPPLVVA